MADPRQLLRGDSPIPDPVLLAGTVSSNKPAPSAIGDPVYVLIDNLSPDHSVPMPWAPLWGTTLPAPGAPVLIAYDDNGVPYVVWWGASAATYPGSTGTGTGTGSGSTTPTWTGFASLLVNSWIAAGPAPAYAILDDVLLLRGNISGGTTGTIIATLPSFPTVDTNQPITAFSGGGTPSYANLNLTTGGVLTATFTAGAGAQVRLDGFAVPLF